MDNLQNELNRDWLNMVLKESLRQWNDFKGDRTDCTMGDFAEFTKKIAEMYFMD